MKVKMLVDSPGSPDGIEVREYARGETYDVTDELGAVLVAHKLAERVLRRAKNAGGPRENKSQ